MRLLALALAACALAGAEIRLRPVVEVPGPSATVGACAEIAAEPELAARLAACTLVELPDLGVRTVGEREVLAACARIAGRGGLAVSGTCRVGRRVRVVGTDELVAAAGARCGEGAEIQVLRSGSSIPAPDGGELSIVAEPLDPSLVGEVPFRVRVLVDGAEAGRTLVTLRIRRFREVCVAARALARGEAVGPADVRRERRELDRDSAQAAGDAAQLVGRVMRRAVEAGSPMSPQQVEQPPVVRAGEAVSLVFCGPGFEVAAAATALADARAGERIAVRRDSDRAVLRGLVDGPGRILAERR